LKSESKVGENSYGALLENTGGKDILPFPVWRGAVMDSTKCCCSSWLFMVALCNRADHYIFILFLLSSSFFPRLISAVGDWMFTILWHMVWP